MTIKRKDFQKAAALIHEFQLKLSEESECSELRDALNLALLHMQKYYRALRSRLLTQDKNNGNLLSGSFRGLSPMTPFRDAPDRFQSKWLNLDNPKLTGTLPAGLHKDVTHLPLSIEAAKTGDNNTLMQVIDRDDTSVLELDGLGRTALFYAVHFGHLDTVQILLEQGSEVNAAAHDGSTAVHRACQDGNNEVLQILIEYQADLNIQDVQGRAPIHWACANRNRECLRLLLEQNASVGMRDKEGMSPSMWACRMDNIEHFELLSGVENQEVLEEDGFERDNSGRTWLHWSVRRTEPLECLKTLLTEDSACLCDDEGKTVMHTAADQGSLPAVKTIVEISGKSCLEHRDNANRTPLILATMSGHGELINYLLAEGADLASVDNSGATAWDYARGRQLHYCMLILASYIRQRASEDGQGPNGMGTLNGDGTLLNGTFPSLVEEDHLGFTQLQINGDSGEDLKVFGNRPIPPPHPPPGPPTPRTPRGFTTPRLDIPEDTSNTPRGYALKRSPPTPIDHANGELLQAQGDQDTNPGSKRKRSDTEPRAERMNVDSTDPHSQHHGNGDVTAGEAEIMNDSQYLEHCGPHGNNSKADQDVDSVSFGEMDVSDIASEGQPDLDPDPPPVSPTAPVLPPQPQPQPRYQLAPPSHLPPGGGQQHYYPSYQPHPPKTPPYHAHSPGHLAPPGFPDPSELQELLQDIDKSDLDLSRSNLESPPPLSPDCRGSTIQIPPPTSPTRPQDTDHREEDREEEEEEEDGYREDDEEDYRHGGPRSPPPNDATPMGEPRNGSLGASMHHNKDGRVIPPAHLLPLDLPPQGPPKPKKKKKKRREHAQSLNPPRGYTAPVNPPGQPPPSPGREQVSPRGGSGEYHGPQSGRRERSPHRDGPGVGAAPPTPKPRERSPAPRLNDQASRGSHQQGGRLAAGMGKPKKRLVHEQEQRFQLDKQLKVAPGQRGSAAPGGSTCRSSSLPAPIPKSRPPHLPQARPRAHLTRVSTEQNLSLNQHQEEEDGGDDYDDDNDDDRDEEDYDNDDDDDDVVDGRGLSAGSGSGHQRVPVSRDQLSNQGGRFANGPAGGGSQQRSRESVISSGSQRRRTVDQRVPPSPRTRTRTHPPLARTGVHPQGHRHTGRLTPSY